LQKTLYLFNNGRIKRKENTICVEAEEGTRYFPIAGVRDIFIFGEVDLNKKFIEFANENELLIHFMGYYGNYVGSFYPREHYNSGYMILNQAEHFLDSGKRFILARLFVEGAIANIIQVLRYYLKRDKNLDVQVDAIKQIKDCRLKDCKSVEELMAAEGNAHIHYYKAFNVITKGSNFFFNRRSRRPPEDPLNALISFGNSLIYMKVLTEIYKTHLDPRIGYLHTTNFRRFTLNLDVAEIFKSIIADRVLFSLVGKKKLHQNDFEKHGAAVLLKEKSRKLYIQEMEDKLQSTFFHRRLKHTISYQTLIRMELYKIEKHLMGDKIYEPFVSQW
jgi:CRISP-associated protein Cas1